MNAYAKKVGAYVDMRENDVHRIVKGVIITMKPLLHQRIIQGALAAQLRHINGCSHESGGRLRQQQHAINLHAVGRGGHFETRHNRLALALALDPRLHSIL